MKTEKELLNKAIDALEETVHVSVDRRTIKSAIPNADFAITYETPTGEQNQILVELKTRLTSTQISQAAITKDKSNHPIVVVSNYISTKSAQELRDLEIQFFDTAGNAYLHNHNFYTFVTGYKAKTKTAEKLGVFRPAGIKLILAFTMEPGLENQDYRTIEEKTGIPKSSVGRVMKDLEDENFLVDRGNSGRILRKRKELLDRWVQYFGEKFRPKLNAVRYHSTKHTGRWWNEIDIDYYKACWGGETAGERLTDYLRPKIATIYAETKLPELQARFGLVKKNNGEIEILKKFWKLGEPSGIAPPLVVYADLLATADERNIETAKMIYARYLTEFTEADS